jgi:hypothetical protein
VKWASKLHCNARPLFLFPCLVVLFLFYVCRRNRVVKKVNLQQILPPLPGSLPV